MRDCSRFAGGITENAAYTNQNLGFHQFELARLETWTGALNISPRKLRGNFRVEATRKLPSDRDRESGSELPARAGAGAARAWHGHTATAIATATSDGNLRVETVFYFFHYRRNRVVTLRGGVEQDSTV